MSRARADWTLTASKPRPRARPLLGGALLMLALAIGIGATGGTVMVEFTPTEETFPNPERGLYTLTFLQHGQSFEGLLDSGFSTVFAYVHLNDYRGEPISDDFLEQISDAFDRARAAGVKVFVRIAYSLGFEEPDADSLEIMATHLEQLEPIFLQHADIIPWFQAGMIGPWGEWHSSPHDTPEGRRRVLDELLDHTPPLSTIAVRTPEDRWEYLTGISQSGVPIEHTLAGGGGPPIVIDGAFDDWGGVPIAFSDVEGDQGGAAADLADVWVASNATHLNLRVRTVQPFDFSGDAHLSAVFDLDRDQATGWSTGSIGSELLLQVTGLYDQRGGEFNEGSLDATATIAPTGPTTQAEIAIPLAAVYPDDAPVFPASGSVIGIDLFSDAPAFDHPPDRLDVRAIPVSEQVTITPEIAHTGSPIARIAHHNDCFLAPPTDLGTYPGDAVELWKDRIAADTPFVPLGGEICGDGHADDSDCAYAIAEMERLRWTYLGGLGLAPLLASCEQEVINRLGYRLELISATLPSSLTAGVSASFEITLRNVGFAPLYNPRPVILRTLLDGAPISELTLEADPRQWLPGGVIVLEGAWTPDGSVALGELGFALWLPDPSPHLRPRKEYAIRLANEGVWDSTWGHSILLGPLWQAAPGIVIDGNFGDWEPFPITATDPEGDHGEALADITAIWMTDDAEELFIRLRSSVPVDFLAGGHVGIFFDMDLNPSTGYPIGAMGSDLLLQGLGLFDQRGGGFNEGQLSAVARGEPSGLTTDVEIAIPLHALHGDGERAFPEPGSPIAIRVYSDSQTHSADEFAPDIDAIEHTLRVPSLEGLQLLGAD